MPQQRTSLAKITAPRLFGVVPRERLFASVDDNRGRPLVWVEGPPGAGKTAFIASYLESRRRPTLWFQVDAGDVDPANLVHYLILAATALLGDSPPSVPRLSPEHLTDLPAFARLFFRALFAQLPPDLVVVLDNYQDVGPDASFHDVMQVMVCEVPAEDLIVCISRAEPPRSFAPFVANGALVRIRWEDLQLDFDETRAMIEATGIRDDWLVKAVHEQSGGWAAGITLMSERLHHVTGDGGALPTDSLESVFNYFATLLFDRASPQVRHVLSSIAFLHRVSPSAAVELSGDSSAPEILDHLFRRHLFIDRRPGAEPVYELHALFRAFLDDRVRVESTEDEVAALRRRSAEASLRAGDADSAFGLYVDAAEWDSAVRLLLGSAPDLLRSGRRATLLMRARALPDLVRDRHPKVWYWVGLAELQTNPLEAVGTLQAALQLMRARGDVEDVLLCLAALLGLGNLGHLALDHAREWASEFLALCDARPGELITTTDPVVWGAAANLFFAQPGHPLTQAMPAWITTGLEADDVSEACLGAAAGALAASTCSGQMAISERIAARMLPFVDAPAASPSEAAWFLFSVGLLRFLQTRYEEAHDFLLRAERVAVSAGLREVLYEIALYRVMVEFRAFGWEVAGRSLREAESVPAQRRPMRVALMRIYQARQATWQGLDRKAADLAEESMAAIEAIGTDHHLMCFGLFNAEVLIRDGRHERAAALIARAREIIWPAPALDSWRAVLLFTETFLALETRGREAALPMLRESLAAARTGTRRYFLRYQECCMPPLFSLALEVGIETDLVLDLIERFRLLPPATAPDAWPRPVRIRTLGRFDVCVNDEPLEYSRKVPKKTLALLKALIAHGAREVPEVWLRDVLWRDEEADAARQALGITVIRLRKLLGCPQAVGQQGARVWLDRERVWVDAWRFDQAGVETDTPAQAARLDLYGGTFLPDDEGESWSVAMRERLRGKFIHALVAQAAQCEAAGEAEAAAQRYLRGLDADPIVEAFHQGLMRCYCALGRPTEAVSAYRRLRQTLSVVLGVAPSTESQRLYQEILATLPAAAVQSLPHEIMVRTTASRASRRRRGASRPGSRP